MRTIRTGKEDHAILTFNGAYNELKEAIRRGVELMQTLTPSQLDNLARARKALDTIWPFLQGEPDISDDQREHAEKLEDLMARETFFRELPAIDKHTQALEQLYQQCYEEVLTTRTNAYQQAVGQLYAIPGWEALDAEQQDRVMEPLATYTADRNASEQSIPKLRADVDACGGRRDQAIENLMRMRDGQRVVCLRASDFFQGGIETEEQLEAALTGLRDHCAELIGAGKKVLVQ